MTNEELEHGRFEIENRIRNLMSTISGDYDLDTACIYRVFSGIVSASDGKWQ